MDGVDEVARDHGGAVAPLGILAQVEGPDQLVVGDLVALGGLVDHVAVRIEADQRIHAQLGVLGPHVDGDAGGIEIARAGDGGDVEHLLRALRGREGQRADGHDQDQGHRQNLANVLHRGTSCVQYANGTSVR